jgi:hypothetical protein
MEKIIVGPSKVCGMTNMFANMLMQWNSPEAVWERDREYITEMIRLYQTLGGLPKTRRDESMYSVVTDTKMNRLVDSDVDESGLR